MAKKEFKRRDSKGGNMEVKPEINVTPAGDVPVIESVREHVANAMDNVRKAAEIEGIQIGEIPSVKRGDIKAEPVFERFGSVESALSTKPHGFGDQIIYRNNEKFLDEIAGASVLGRIPSKTAILELNVINTDFISLKYPISAIREVLQKKPAFSGLIKDLRVAPKGQGLLCVLNKMALKSNKKPTRYIESLSSDPLKFLNLEAVPQELLTLTVDNLPEVAVANPDLVLLLDPAKVAEQIILPSIIGVEIENSKLYESYTQMSNVVLKDYTLYVAFTFKAKNTKDKVKVSYENFVAYNGNYTKEEIIPLMNTAVNKINEGSYVEFFKTGSVITTADEFYEFKSEMVSLKDGNTLLEVPMFCIPDLNKEVDILIDGEIQKVAFIKKSSKTGNGVLDRLMGMYDNRLVSPTFNDFVFLNLFGQILDGKVFTYQVIDKVFVLPNLKALTMLAILKGIRTDVKLGVKFEHNLFSVNMSI